MLVLGSIILPPTSLAEAVRVPETRGSSENGAPQIPLFITSIILLNKNCPQYHHVAIKIWINLTWIIPFVNNPLKMHESTRLIINLLAQQLPKSNPSVPDAAANDIFACALQQPVLGTKFQMSMGHNYWNIVRFTGPIKLLKTDGLVQTDHFLWTHWCFTQFWAQKMSGAMAFQCCIVRPNCLGRSDFSQRVMVGALASGPMRWVSHGNPWQPTDGAWFILLNYKIKNKYINTLHIIYIYIERERGREGERERDRETIILYIYIYIYL